MAASREGVVTDAEKQVLLERYLDIVWCEDVSEVQCARCHRVPIHHYMSNCQHLFCRNCRTVFSDGGQWKCPQCHTYVTQLSDQDWQLEERIYQFKVHCPNKKYGCPYQGQLKTIPGHLKRCDNTREAALPAEFKGITLDTVVDKVTKLNDAIEFLRNEMKEIRDQCETDRRQTETMVNELMANREVLTPDLKAQKERLALVDQLLKDVKELRDKCEIEWKQSKENDDELTRDLQSLKWDLHEQKEQSANVKQLLKEKEASAAIEIQQLRSKVEDLETLLNTKLKQFEQMIKHLLDGDFQGKSGVDETINVEETERMVNQDGVNLNATQMSMGQTEMPQEELVAMTQVYDWDITIDDDGRMDNTRESEPFPLTGYDYGTKIKLGSSGHISFQLIDYYNTKRPIDMTFVPKIACVIKDLGSSSDKRDVFKMTFFQFKLSSKYGKDICDRTQWSPLAITGPPYLVSNRMKIKVYIEPPSIARSFFSNDGILLWTLDNYKKRKQMEVDKLIECQFSPYFYTSPRGYRMHLRLYLSEKTVRCVLLYLKGEFDSSLTQQFPHLLTMTIFNHTDQSKDLVISQKRKGAEFTEVVFKTESASMLENGGYVKDDSIIIKAVVEPA